MVQIRAATSINAAEQVVGQSETTGGGQEAFLYNAGVMIGLGTLGGVNSYAYGINAAGQIVGQADTAMSGVSDAFLYSGGVMTDLGTLGGTFSEALGINDAGQIVGDAATSKWRRRCLCLQRRRDDRPQRNAG